MIGLSADRTGYFLLTSLVVIVTPGPDAALVLRLVLRHGSNGPARAAAAGMISAGVLHAGLAIGGVSLLLAERPTLFTALQGVGAAALVWWGIRSIRDAAEPTPPAAETLGPTARRCYLAGLFCTGTNPKVGLFFLAFLPQFVPPGATLGPTMAFLAAVHLAFATVWLLTLAELIRRWRRRILGGSVQRVVQVLTGILFIGLAARLVLGG